MNSDYYLSHSQMEGDQPHGMQQPQRYSSGGNRGGNYPRQPGGQSTGNHQRHPHPTHQQQTQQQQPTQNQAAQHQPGTNVTIRAPNLQQAASGYIFPQQMPYIIQSAGPPGQMIRYPAAYPAAPYNPQYQQGQQYVTPQQQQHLYAQAQQQINAYNAAAYASAVNYYQNASQQPQNPMHHGQPAFYPPHPSHQQPVPAVAYMRTGVPTAMPVQQQPTQQSHAVPVAVQGHQPPQLTPAPAQSVLMQPAVIPGGLVTHASMPAQEPPREPPVPKKKRILLITDPATGKAVIDANAGSDRAPSSSPQPTAEPVSLPEDINVHGGGQGGHDDQNAYDGVPPAFGQSQPAMIHDEPQSVAPVAPPADGQGKNKAKSDFFQRITAAADDTSSRSHSTPDAHTVTGHPTAPLHPKTPAIATVALETPVTVAASAPPAFTHPQVPPTNISQEPTTMGEPEKLDTSTSLPSQLPKEQQPIGGEPQGGSVPELQAETEPLQPPCVTSDLGQEAAVSKQAEETSLLSITTEEEMNNTDNVVSTPQSGGRGDQFLDLSMASISPEPIEKYIERTPEKIPEVVSEQSGEPSPISNDSETEPSVPVPEVPVVKTEEIRPPPTNSELKTEDEISKVEKGLEELKITAVDSAQIEPIFTNGGNEIDEGMGDDDIEEGELHEGDMESDESGEPVKKGRIVYDRDTLINYKTSASKDLVPGISDSIPPELIRDGNSPSNIGPPPRSQGINYGVGGGYGRQNSAQGGRMGNNNAGPFPNRMRGMQGPGGWDPMRGPFQIPPQPPGPNRPPVTIQTRPVSLHKAKDAWKPGRGIDETKDQEERLIEEMKKNTRGILNKLTPENFDKLLEKFLMLKFEEEVKEPEKRSDADRAEAEAVTAGRIGAVISVVFEKAIDEPSFSAAYAKMVHQVHSKATAVTSKIFRKKILDQCQKEFQQGNSIEDEVKVLEEKLAAEVEEDKKPLIKLEIEDKKFTARRRSLGNVRFIGELFKLQMLTPKIMIECVNMLISSGDEESLECLCKLLTTVGKRLEENIAQMIETMRIKKPPPSKWMPDPNFMNNTFTKLRALSDDKTYSSRIRFALLDVVELRADSWVPRRDLNAPKTKEEVRRAIIREEQEEKKQLMNLPPASSPRGPMGGPPIPKKTDEWMSVSAKKSSRFSAAAKKTGPDSSGDLPKLAPGGGPWGMQSARGGGSGYPPRSSLPPRFSAGRESSDGPLPPPSRDAIVQALPQTKSPSSHSSRESSRPQTPTKDSNSGSPRVPPPLTMTTRKTPPPTPQQPPEQIKDFDPKDAVKQIFEEFRSVKKVDFDWIEKRFPGDRRLDFVNELCTRVCDMSKEDDEKTAGGLIKCLIKADKITKAQVIQSLKDKEKDGILLLLPDVEIDAPLATSYLATCLTEVFMDEEDLGWLIRLGEGIEEDLGDTWTNLVSKVLEKLKHRFSEAVVQGLYKKTQGADRLPTEDSCQWVHGESLESIADKLSKVLRSMSEDDTLGSVLQENSFDFRETDVMKGVTESICIVSWSPSTEKWDPITVKRFFSQLPSLQNTKHFPIIWNQVKDFMERQNVNPDQREAIWGILSPLEIAPLEKAK